MSIFKAVSQDDIWSARTPQRFKGFLQIRGFSREVAVREVMDLNIKTCYSF
jgi:hypothetical protein